MPVPLPRPGALDPDDCDVPPGWFACGGYPHEMRSLSARRIWVDGHIFRRFPVTNSQFMAFLDALVVEGCTEEALRHAPRERGGTVGELGSLIYGFDETRFSLRPDADADVWLPEYPVCLVDWHAARAFVDWEASRMGRSWRLPGERAWEKVARGVDGRVYPWGDGFDPSWACMRRSHPDRILPAVVGAFSVDESPCGICDLAESMQEWCLDAHSDTGPPAASARHDATTIRAGSGAGVRAGAANGDVADPAEQAGYRVFRGGCWYSPAASLRASKRFRGEPTGRIDILGFRLAQSYPVA